MGGGFFSVCFNPGRVVFKSFFTMVIYEYLNAESDKNYSIDCLIAAARFRISFSTTLLKKRALTNP